MQVDLPRTFTPMVITASADADTLRDWVRQYLGMSFNGDQRETFNNRIVGFCVREQLTVEQILKQLDRNEPLLRRLENALSTPYTYFLREPEAFEFLTNDVLPHLRNELEVRMWSAAAATGDEAWSMAMVTREVYGDAGPPVRILATDISEQQVSIGERGEIPEAHMHDLDAARRRRWFRPTAAGKLEVVPELRALCTFRRLNLATIPWPFEQKFHVIFLRNVLYYFDEITLRAVLQAASEKLVKGGALITSVTEPIERVPWGLVRLAPGIYRRTE
jgi:chemotaxis protein methyltransferase CheR